MYSSILFFGRKKTTVLMSFLLANKNGQLWVYRIAQLSATTHDKSKIGHCIASRTYPLVIVRLAAYFICPLKSTSPIHTFECHYKTSSASVHHWDSCWLCWTWIWTKLRRISRLLIGRQNWRKWRIWMSVSFGNFDTRYVWFRRVELACFLEYF